MNLPRPELELPFCPTHQLQLAPPRSSAPDGSYRCPIPECGFCWRPLEAVEDAE